MDYNKKLSIIIPIYNLDKYISDCLDSIINDANDVFSSELEIILINDGSKDDSEKICLDYCKKYEYIKYYYQKNSGVSNARNNGFSKSNGKYIWFVDGDDLIIKGSLNKIMPLLNSDKDMISARFVKTKEVHNITSTKKYKYFDEEGKKSYPQNLINILKNNQFNPSLCCNIIKKELFTKNNITINEELKYTEDMDCFLKLFINSKKIAVLENPIYIYRQGRNESATKSITQKRVQDQIYFYITWNHKLETLSINAELKQELMNFINYEYAICVALAFCLNKTERENEISKIYEYRKVLKNISGKKGKIIKTIYSILGFNFTGKIMSLWIRKK